MCKHFSVLKKFLSERKEERKKEGTQISSKISNFIRHKPTVFVYRSFSIIYKTNFTG
jgi:hypothetical protein